MGILTRTLGAFFNKPAASQQPVIEVPLRDINIALRSRPDLLVVDHDYTDFVLRTVGAPRRQDSMTLRYTFNPDQRYLEDRHDNAEKPMRFYGSEGMLMTAYPGNGLAFILHDQIRKLHDNAPGRHVVLAMDGLCDLAAGTYHVRRMLAGSMDKHDRIYALNRVTLTQKDVERGVAVLALSMRQMLGGDRLTIRENKHKALYIDRSALDSVLDSLYSAKNLDNPAPNP